MPAWPSAISRRRAALVQSRRAVQLGALDGHAARERPPPALPALLDFALLTTVPGSFVDDEFASVHADLLYSVTLARRSAYVDVLFDHQSTVDPLMLLHEDIRSTRQRGESIHLP